MIGNIRAYNAQIAREQRRRLGHLPVPLAVSLTAWREAETGVRLPSIPFLGRTTVKGFRPLLDDAGEPLEWFVDISGLGTVGEPALTRDQFIREAIAATEKHGTLAWGVTEVGQFQGYVRAWRVRA